MINFSAVSHVVNRTWFGSAVRFPLSLIPKEQVVPILQGPLRGKRWIVGSCVHSCWLGSYELAEATQIASSVKPGSIFFDIGAQAGYHTLFASQLVGPTGRVFAFEPVPTNAANLRKHIALNHLANVIVVEAAVSDLDGTVRFDNGLNAMAGHLSPDGSLGVRSLSLDREIERGALPEPDFIKIDVEGAEAKVLQGARDLLTRRHPVLLVETHQWMPIHESSHRDSCNLLQAFGYELLQGNATTLNSAYHICARPAVLEKSATATATKAIS